MQSSSSVVVVVVVVVVQGRSQRNQAQALPRLAVNRSSSLSTGSTLEPVGSDARHFVRCPRGLRFDCNTVSDRVRDELAYILKILERS